MDRLFLVLLFWILPLSTWADQHLKMDTSEVTIAEFSEFADAVGLLTKAEKEGGMVYESGWVTKKGWNWRTPYGIPSPPDEPAVHIIPLTRHLLFVDGKKSVCQAAKNGSMRLIRKIVKIQLMGFKKGRPIVSQRVIPQNCLLYTSPSPRDQRGSRMPSSA